MGNTGSSFFWPNQDPGRLGAGLDAANARESFYREVDRSGFNWLVYLVAASGFFTDSYNLFASNVILPAIAYVYWQGPAHSTATAFNLATLASSAVGQLLFGYLADRFGRRSLYGIELIIVIISTAGLLQCSNGYSDIGRNQHTWSINGWLLFWRTVMGLGIGAEYPLSACLAAEWSSTESRGRMISAVFLMQPLGQLCAYGAGLTALQVFGSSSPVDIDKLWRYVVAMGAIPTLLALGFRLFMPESGRYTFEVRQSPPEDDSQTPPQDSAVSIRSASARSQDAPSTRHIRMNELWHFLYDEGHGVTLFGTSACWFLLDFAFYGLGFNTPSTLSKLWSSADLPDLPGDAPYWLTSSSATNVTGFKVVNGSFHIDPADQGALIHDVLMTNMTHGIYTVSISSILGSLAVIALINRFDRKNMLTVSFSLLAVLLIVACGSFKALFHQGDRHIVLIMLWVLISLLFSFGPNTLTFIIPAEVFPTRYRCTLYGFSAAIGKLGAVFVQIVILCKSSLTEPNSSDIRWLLLAFAACMGLGALLSHFFVPSVQRRSTDRDLRTGWQGRERRAPLYVNLPLQDLPRPRRRAAIELRDQGNGRLGSERA